MRSDSPTHHAPLTIDHVTVAGSNLDVLRKRFAEVGLDTDYGGEHSNGVTHMALLGFDDGSYVELISTRSAGAVSPWWPRQIASDAGLASWCARSDNIAAESERLRSLDIAVRGPSSYQRVRPDGTRIEWELAFPGTAEPGALIPFLIQDRTPRDLRVQPSPLLTGTELTGIARVVLGVEDLAAATALFQRLYGSQAMVEHVDFAFGARVVSLTGAPVALATPVSPASWLARRLAQFGDCPAGLLLRSRNLERSARRFPLARAGSWLGPALWFDPDRLGGLRLGIIEEVA